MSRPTSSLDVGESFLGGDNEGCWFLYILLQGVEVARSRNINGFLCLEKDGLYELHDSNLRSWRLGAGELVLC